MKTHHNIFLTALLSLALIPVMSFAAPSADLSISANLDYNGPSLQGQGSTHSLTISNAGPDTATGVVVRNQLPPNVQVIGISAGEAIVAADGRVTINFDTLPAGQSVTFDLEEAPTAQFIGLGHSVNPVDLLSATLTNNFVISANESDPNLSNNSATTVIDVVYTLPGTPSSPYDLGPLYLSPSNRAIVDFMPEAEDRPSFYGGRSIYKFPYIGGDYYTYANLNFSVGYSGDVVILGGTNTGASANTDMINWLAVVRFFDTNDPTGTHLAAYMKKAFFPASVIGPDGFTDFTLFPNAVFVTGSVISTNGFIRVSADYGAVANGYFGTPYYYEIRVTADHAPTGVSLTAESTPEPVVVGHDLTYLLTVSNSMPRLATGVTISNLLPANVAFVSVAGGTVTTNKGALLINAGSLAPGATRLVTLVVKPNVVENLTNVFNVFADQPDANPSAGLATVVSTVNALSTSLSADVSVTTTNFLSGIQDEYIVPARSNLTCWLTVSNAGPATATGLTLSDFIPANVNFVSATGGTVTRTNGAIVVKLASLPAGATNQVQIVVQPTIEYVNTTLVSFVLLTNFFEVSANEPDPVVGNNTTNIVVGVSDIYPGTPLAGPGTNLSQSGIYVTVGMTAENGIVESPFEFLTVSNLAVFGDLAIPGDLVLLTGTNGGNANVSNWAAVMRFFNPADPDGTLGLPATSSEAFFPASVTGGVGFTNFSLFPNTLYTLEGAGSSQTFVENVIIEYGPAGAILHNQAAYMNYYAIYSPTADLDLSASGPDASVQVGSNMVYSMTVSNAGPQIATGLVISNQLPAGVNFVSANGGATLTNGAVLVSLGSLAIGATETAQIVLQSTVPGLLTNEFQVFSTETDPNTTNNSAVVVSRADNAATTADLVLTAEASSAQVTVGNNFIYTLTAHNAGPMPATGILISNALPANVHFLWATGATGVNATGGSLVLNIGPLASGATELVQIFARSTQSGEVTNQFKISANEADFNVSNNIVAVVTSAGAGSPMLRITSPKFGAQLSNQVTLDITGGTPGLNYTIEYSSNLVTWLPAASRFTSNPNGVQWVDAGPPQTDSAPQKRGARYYRATLQPQ